MRHKDKAILYWFRPPESKTLHPVLRFVLLRSQVGLHGRGVNGLLPKRAPLLALYWVTDKVGGPESGSITTGKPISSLFTSWKAYPSCLNLFWTALSCTPSCLLVFKPTCQVGRAY
jgi:hypothetical protein